MHARIRFVLLAASIGACDHPSTAPASPPASIVITSSLTVGLHARYTLAPVVFDASGHDITTSAKIHWTSSNAAIATVNDSGVVTALALGGPATITGTLGGASATTQVVVVPGDVAIAPIGHGVALNTSLQLTAQARDFLGAPIDAGAIVWSSSAPGVASVDAATGVLATVGIGTATIGASAAGRTGSITIFVDAPSPYDGHYTSTGNNAPVSVTVFLGHITDFSAMLSVRGCATAISGQPDVPIGTIVETFTSVLGISVPGANFTVPASSLAPSTANVSISFDASTGGTTGAINGPVITDAPACGTAAPAASSYSFFAVR